MISKFVTSCPYCHLQYSLDISLKGKHGVCQQCKKTFVFDDAPKDQIAFGKTKTVISEDDNDIACSKSHDQSFSLAPDLVQSDYDFGGDDASSEHTSYQVAELLNSNLSDAKSWKVGDILLGVYEVRPMPDGSPYAEGGVGVVHRVYHRDWDIELAVKSPKLNIFKTELGRLSYERECRTWIDLGLHPNIVTCYLARRINGIPRLFAELVVDGSLSDWIRSGRLYQGDVREVHQRILDMAIQFCWGLDYAHRQGLLHLDIKPANVLLSGDTIKVTDFGLAQAVAAATDSRSEGHANATHTTWDGMTPGYCSPEQHKAFLLYQAKNFETTIPITSKSDIWSWAISVLTMFYGRPPCKKGGQTAAKTFEQYLMLPVSEGKPKMTDAMIELMRHCFQYEPENRPKSMSEIGDRLVDIYQSVAGERYQRVKPTTTASTAESLNNRAASMIDLGNIKESRTLFAEALKLHAWHPQATYNQALLEWRTGKKNDIETVKQLEALVGSHPKNTMVDYFLGLIQRERGNLTDAVNLFKHAYEMDPKEEYRRYFDLTKKLLEDEVRCIERFRLLFLDHPFVLISEDERMILCAIAPNLIRVYDTVHGRLCAEFQRKGDEHVAATNATDPPGDDRAIFDDAKNRLTSGLVFEMLYAQNLPPMLSYDLAWELKRGMEAGTFFLHRVNANSRPIVFRLLQWETSGTEESVPVSEMLTNSNGDVVVSRKVALYDGVACIVTLQTGEVGIMQKKMTPLVGHEGDVLSCYTTPDGLFAVTGGSDKSVRLWSLNSKSCLRTFRGGEGLVKAVYISRDKHFVLSLADNNILKLWNTDILLNRPQELRAPIMLCLVISSEKTSQNQSELIEICYLAKEATARADIAEAIGQIDKAKKIQGWKSINNTINQWDLVGRFSIRDHVNETVCRSTLSDQHDIVSSVAISFDGSVVLSAGRSPTILIYDVVGNKCKGELNRHDDWIRSVDITSDGRFAVSGSWDQTIRLWNVEKQIQLRKFKERIRSISRVLFSPNARLVAVSTTSGSIYFLDPTTGYAIASWHAHDGGVNSIRFNRDGRFLVSGGEDGKARLWDVSSQHLIADICQHNTPIMAVCPDTILSRVAVASQDGMIQLCRTVTKDNPVELKGHTGAVTSLVLTPDDRWVISGSKDRTIRIWNAENQTALKPLTLHHDTITDLALDLSAMRLVSASEDETVKFWDIDWQYRFPGWQDRADALDDYIRVLLAIHTPRDNVSATQSALMPMLVTLEERIFRRVRTELEYRGFGWVKPEMIWERLNAYCNADS